MTISESQQEILRKIFSFHRLGANVKLKQEWAHTLGLYSAEQIRIAWNEFRTNKRTMALKPTPDDILKIIRRRAKPFGFDETQCDDRLQRGRSELEDMLIDHMEKNQDDFSKSELQEIINTCFRQLGMKRNAH